MCCDLCLYLLTVGLPVLHFRVKFWVSDPGKLAEEFTRYQLVSQLKKDVVQGRLSTPLSTAALLASYVLQGNINYICFLDRLLPNFFLKFLFLGYSYIYNFYFLFYVFIFLNQMIKKGSQVNWYF